MMNNAIPLSNDKSVIPIQNDKSTIPLSNNKSSVPLSNDKNAVPINVQKEKSINILNGDDITHSMLPLWLKRIEDILKDMDQLAEDVVVSVSEYNGTISIEHKDGTINTMKLVKTVEDIASNDNGNVELQIISNADIDKLFK